MVQVIALIDKRRRVRHRDRSIDGGRAMPLSDGMASASPTNQAAAKSLMAAATVAAAQSDAADATTTPMRAGLQISPEHPALSFARWPE
jgi:hypothetical protein